MVKETKEKFLKDLESIEADYLKKFDLLELEANEKLKKRIEEEKENIQKLFDTFNNNIYILETENIDILELVAYKVEITKEYNSVKQVIKVIKNKNKL